MRCCALSEAKGMIIKMGKIKNFHDLMETHVRKEVTTAGMQSIATSLQILNHLTNLSKEES